MSEISNLMPPSTLAVVTLDGAGWHKLGGLPVVPSNISLRHLPSYSPGLNPVENVRQFQRQNFLSNRVFGTYHAIVDACCNAWNACRNATSHSYHRIKAWGGTVNA